MRTSNIQRPTLNVQRRAGLALVLVLVLDIASAQNEPPDVIAAAQPLADGVPEVAVVRLRELLSSKPQEEIRRAATVKLGEALVAAAQPEDALKILDDPQVRDLSTAKFSRAQALASLARWAEALPLYRQAAADPAFVFRAEAAFGHAEALRALGRTAEAVGAFRAMERDRQWTVRARLRAVELLLESKDARGAERLLAAVEPTTAAQRKERRLLRGRIEAELGNHEKALELFRSILARPGGATHPVLIATVLAWAEVHLKIGSPGAGDDLVEDFIVKYSTDRDLPRIFAKLDQLYAGERRQARHDLGKWSRESVQPLRALAQWYLARAELRLGRTDVALTIFERLRAENPRLPALAEAFLEDAQLQLEQGRSDDALAALDTARALEPGRALRERIEMLAGRSHYAAGRFDSAAQTFRKVPHNHALFNVTLAWLQAGDAPQVAAATQELKSRGDEEMRGEVLLEQGLVEAARKGGGATKTLQNFLREFPKHHRASEGWVALAELAFHAAPPRLEEARQNLARARETNPTPAATERADYLMIWLEESAPERDEQSVIELANQFLQKHPESPFLPDVRLKLGETFFRRQDFASAQTQFEILAQRNPASPIAEKALFFAGQSAMQSMGGDSLARALLLFDEVVKKGGELKWAARNEQAVIERKLGQPQDAVTFYDEVLRGDAKGPEKREALCGKGDIFYELGANDPENYRRAIELYEQLAQQPEASAHWRNQALFKKGMCLEKLNAPVDALATFYRIIEDEARPGRQREFFWFYKAGFNAARLLEEDSKWQPAAAVYEKLAFAGGGRSEEARSRLNRLRLEHFLWEQ